MGFGVHVEAPSTIGGSKRRLVELIELLCTCGAGLEAIAGPLCDAVQALLGASACSVFWLDEKRNPVGFFHNGAPAELKDLFITQFEQLFVGSDQENMLTMTEIVGPSIGRALSPDFLERFWNGNVYRHLCAPLGHRHLLDMRIELDGVGRALFLAWNDEARPFSRAHAELLRPLQPVIGCAVAHERPDARWQRVGTGAAHFVTALDGRTLCIIDPEAEMMLKRSHLLHENFSMTRQVDEAPGFALPLSQMLAAGVPATMSLAIANGRIVARARRTRALAGSRGAEELMFVVLDHMMSFDVLCIQYLARRNLSPLQLRIALFGMQGGERGACAEALGISTESLKKHLAIIFEVVGAGKWTDLAAIAQANAELAATGWA
jgi:DNA-binding CsgD family transcriptional regulator